MSRYEGLNPSLRREVVERDNARCRWCGATNRGADLHHIRYRRGVSDDVAGNLICLCRTCHGFVHGTPSATGVTISKARAQKILYELIERPGWTGTALWRRDQRDTGPDARSD